MTGAEWELAEFMHPWASYNRTVYVLEGNHVTLDAGTGCVHTALGHGVDDFEVYKKYENEGKLKQEVICPVDNKGRMTAEAGSFGRKDCMGSGRSSISALAHEGMLLGKSPFTTSMPIAGAVRIPSFTARQSSGLLPSMIFAKMH